MRDVRLVRRRPPRRAVTSEAQCEAVLLLVMHSVERMSASTAPTVAALMLHCDNSSLESEKAEGGSPVWCVGDWRVCVAASPIPPVSFSHTFSL